MIFLSKDELVELLLDPPVVLLDLFNFALGCLHVLGDDPEDILHVVQQNFFLLFVLRFQIGGVDLFHVRLLLGEELAGILDGVEQIKVLAVLL